MPWGKYRTYPPLTNTATGFGKTNLGKTTIECTFLGTETKWGSLEGQPAGILCLHLNFQEHPDYNLKHTTIDIAFLGDADSKKPQVTEHVTPKIMYGLPREITAEVIHRLTPEIGAQGFSIGGVGVEWTSNRTDNYRWRFKGDRTADDDLNLTQVQWIWEANPLEPQACELGSVYMRLIVALEGNCHQKFSVGLRIEGKLRWKAKRGDPRQLLRFSSSTPIIRDVHPVSGTTNLRQDADGLHERIKNKNGLTGSQ
jgi:hypothetical protein